MKVKINTPNPGTWFNFKEDNSEEGGVCVRAVTPSVLAEIEKKNSKKHFEYAAPVGPNGRRLPAQRFEWIEYDEEALFADRWDYCIVDWRNLTDENNVPIPCERENKAKLMGENLLFSAFILQCLTKLNEVVSAEMKESAKNLFGTSKDTSGNSTAETA